MPRIFDNIDQHLLPALTKTLQTATMRRFSVSVILTCAVGERLAPYVLTHGTVVEGAQCRLLIGMQGRPGGGEKSASRSLYRLGPRTTRRSIKTSLSSHSTSGGNLPATTHVRDAQQRRRESLQTLAQQLRDGKLVVKLFLRYPLHAKLYSLYRDDYNNPVTGFQEQQLDPGRTVQARGTQRRCFGPRRMQQTGEVV